MFDTTKTSLTGRIADTLDLLIDLATLGEYGLEPVNSPGPGCQSRRRPHPPQPSRRRNRADGRFAIQR